MKKYLFLLGVIFASCLVRGQDNLHHETPCTGGSIVNFDKVTNVIIETRCDSLKFLYNYIQNNAENFVIIGIYTSKNDEKSKQKAKDRAALVRQKLIEMGIDENRLSVHLSYFNPPEKDDHHDWPFYPPHFTYEIGVYIQGDY